MEDQMTTRDEYVKKLIEVHGTDQTVDIIALAKLTGKSLPDVVSAFHEGKVEVNKSYYGIGQ